jgi:putative ubiquitin-RnfH superfamily antitoxin RatB of RatAB toxin-antitoxin module
MTVCYAPGARELVIASLELPAGSTVRAALAAVAHDARFTQVLATEPVLGLRGKKTSLDHTLHDRDRLEIYRPLRVDPKVARRERFAKQGARSTGLFATRRPGAKSGY